MISVILTLGMVCGDDRVKPRLQFLFLPNLKLAFQNRLCCRSNRTIKVPCILTRLVISHTLAIISNAEVKIVKRNLPRIHLTSLLPLSSSPIEHFHLHSNVPVPKQKWNLYLRQQKGNKVLNGKGNTTNPPPPVFTSRLLQ